MPEATDNAVPPAIDEMSEKVRRWLVEEDWFVDAQPPPEPQPQQPPTPGHLVPFPQPSPTPPPRWFFWYNCKKNNGQKFQVAQPRTHQETIFLFSGTNLSPNHGIALSILSPPEKVDFAYSLLSRLVMLNADIARFEVADDVVKLVRMQRSLPYDGLTKLAFTEAVSEITKVHSLVQAQIDWALAKHASRAT